MGLSLSHCDAQWSYGGFRRFRCWLWNKAGFEGDLYDLYDDYEYTKYIAHHHYLAPLFFHSDCEGELTPQECISILKGLTKLKLNEDEIIYYGSNLFDLKEGLLKCFEMNENMEFH